MSLSGSFSFETDQTALARALVHPEKPVRDATIQNIAQYLGKLSTVSELNMLKLWKALYYCLWLTDKEAMQREVASVMSQLLHTLPNLDMQLLYMRTFFITVLREWLNCDQHRINKLYVLLRLFLREILVLIVDTCNYDTAVVEAVMQTLAAEVFCKTPNGVRFHLTDIFVEELAGVSRGKVNSTRFVALVQPFLSAMACHQDSAFHDRITKRVFLAFLHERSNEAREANKQRVRSASVTSGTEGEEEPQVEETTFAEDHIWLRKVNTRLLQAVIFELASAAATEENPGGVPDHCRKRLYALHKEYAKATGCSYLSVADALGAGGAAATKEEGKEKPSKKKTQKTPEAAAAPAVVEKAEKAEKVSKKRAIAAVEKTKETPVPASAAADVATPKDKKGKRAKTEAEATPAVPAPVAEAAAPKSAKKAAKEPPAAPASASSEQAKIKAVLSSMDGAKAAPSAAAATAAGSKAAPSLPPPRNVQGVLIETVSMPKNAGKTGAAAPLAATNGKRVKMHYTGKLKSNGKVFDSSVPRGKPFQFRLGAGEVIRGWDIGVKDMLVGERRILTIPPEKGYGRGGAPPQIPGNASLVFDITCMGVN